MGRFEAKKQFEMGKLVAQMGKKQLGYLLVHSPGTPKPAKEAVHSW